MRDSRDRIALEMGTGGLQVEGDSQKVPGGDSRGEGPWYKEPTLPIPSPLFTPLPPRPLPLRNFKLFPCVLPGFRSPESHTRVLAPILGVRGCVGQ